MLATAFTPFHRAAIDNLRKELIRRTHRSIVAEFGATEDGQFHDVAMCVEELPIGARGRPGPLVSILTGIGGDGFAVMQHAGSACGKRSRVRPSRGSASTARNICITPPDCGGLATLFAALRTKLPAAAFLRRLAGNHTLGNT